MPLIRANQLIRTLMSYLETLFVIFINDPTESLFLSRTKCTVTSHSHQVSDPDIPVSP